MGLVLLGADNLASDQADQKPSTMKRSKDGAALPWPERRIEVTDLDGGHKKITFYYYSEWPGSEWSAVRSTLGNPYFEVDMSTCTMKKIGNFAFGNEYKMTKVTLPPHLEEIGTQAFGRCGTNANIDEFVVIMPSTVKIIGSNAFSNCSSLKLGTLPDSIETIGYQAFYKSGLSISKLPAHLREVGQNAFTETNVTVQKLSSGITFGASAFEKCLGITNIEIACKNVTLCMFRNCTALQKVWLRSSCEEIYGHGEKFHAPFYACQPDLEIYAEPASKPDGWETYYNITGVSPDYVEVEVVFGQTTSPF